jgi:beta-lactamase superfamily II metal-dependent hydrolase
MYDYGTAPSADEAEIVVFGPGYGEAIAVHLGDRCWLLVDSCLTPTNDLPASIDYLNRIGVGLDAVRVIVASHWHDDHVKGLAKMVASCPNAVLQISGVFNDREAAAFLSAYGGDVAAVHTAGARELFRSILAARSRVFLTQRSIVFEDKNIQGRAMRAVAFSPTQNAVAQFIAHISQYVPQAQKPIQHAPELKPNLEAVVISIDLGGDGILLGSDLEDHGNLGWSAIVGDEWCLSNQRASAYKVAHHGSITGHHPGIWSDLLDPKPVAVLTPFNKAAHRLPNSSDKERIGAHASATYMSSNGSRKPQLDVALHKQMALVGKDIAPVKTGFGAVRFRKKLGSPDWGVELFGQATRL